jgi:hypothetical protein
LPTFQRYLLPPSSYLMMEAASTSEKSVNFYQTTRRNITEDSQLLNMTKLMMHYTRKGTSFVQTVSDDECQVSGRIRFSCECKAHLQKHGSGSWPVSVSVARSVN